MQFVFHMFMVTLVSGIIINYWRTTNICIGVCTL